MHPNDSEFFTGGVGGPSDPALVKGGQDHDPDELIRDSNIVGRVILAALLLVGGLALLRCGTPDWLSALLHAQPLVLLAWLNPDMDALDRCATPDCDGYALGEAHCRRCTCEMQDAPETVEVVS